MIKAYIPYRNSDATEGRGPMVPEKFGFLKKEDCDNYMMLNRGIGNPENS